MEIAGGVWRAEAQEKCLSPSARTGRNSQPQFPLHPYTLEARGEAEVRGGRKEGLNRPNRTAVEDAEGHAWPAPSEATRRGGPRRDGRAGPPPLLPLPPASGSRRSDASRGLLRSDVGASVGDPASSRKAGRRPDRLTVLRRVPRCGAAAAATGSKSSLKGRSPGGNVVRPGRARRNRSGRGAGLCATTPAAIPIAPLHTTRGCRRCGHLDGQPVVDYPVGLGAASKHRHKNGSNKD